MVRGRVGLGGVVVKATTPPASSTSQAGQGLCLHAGSARAARREQLERTHAAALPSLSSL